MGKELKFKCWDGKMFHEWGYLNPYGVGIVFVSPPNPAYPSYQFTGVVDKNGVEIYEGDIVKYIDHPTGRLNGDYEVIIDAGFIGLSRWDIPLYNSEPHKWMEVIANQHKQPV